MLVALQDEGADQIKTEAYDALKIAGSLDPVLEFRSSYALIGYKGPTRPTWVKESKSKPGLGPTVLEGAVPFILPPVRNPEG